MNQGQGSKQPDRQSQARSKAQHGGAGGAAQQQQQGDSSASADNPDRARMPEEAQHLPGMPKGNKGSDKA